jgi:glutathione S-transferase
MLTILGRESSINVRKALWCADELGLPYAREDWGKPGRDPNVPEFLRLNPNAQVPVIVEDGFVLWESGAILRHLARDSDALWPKDPERRAIVDQWLTWQATELNPPWGYAVYALLRHEAGFDDESRIAGSLAKWGAKMAILEAQLADTGAYAAGDAFTLADIALGLSVRRWYAIPRALPELPSVRRYYGELKQRPAGATYMRDELF